MIKSIINKGLKRVGYKVVKLSTPVTEFYKESTPTQISKNFSYEDAMQFIFGLHVTTEGHIRTASIPKESLEYTSTYFKDLPKDRPLIALHIGNFVGISLTWMADQLRKIHPNSVVVSIDPNIIHRGVKYPLEVVIKLTNYFSLEENIIVLIGYSLEKNISDGANTEHDGSMFRNGSIYPSFENTLQNLELFSEQKYDLALIDGNHESTYLSREIDHIYHLLKKNGLLILDDISDYWENRAQLKSIYDNADEKRFIKVGTDGRVGILRKRNNEA